MPDTTAKFREKQLGSTGVTEDLAERMFAHKGKHYMFIVEAKVDEVHDKTDGKQRADLVITMVEPADPATTDGKMLEDHLRELARGAKYTRGLDDSQPSLLSDSDGPNPKIGDVIAQGNALRLTDEQVEELEAREAAEAEDEDDDGEDDEDEAPDDDGGDTAEDLAAHGTSNVLTVPFGDGQDAGRRDDPITDPHTYVDTTTGLCAMCDQPAGHELHQAVSA